MNVTLNGKGQVTIPKRIRDAIDLQPGCSVMFVVNREGEIVIRKVLEDNTCKPDRYESVRGVADIKWRTEDLMALLRPA